MWQASEKQQKMGMRRQDWPPSILYLIPNSNKGIKKDDEGKSQKEGTQTPCMQEKKVQPSWIPV